MQSHGAAQLREGNLSRANPGLAFRGVTVSGRLVSASADEAQIDAWKSPTGLLGSKSNLTYCATATRNIPSKQSESNFRAIESIFQRPGASKSDPQLCLLQYTHLEALRALSL